MRQTHGFPFSTDLSLTSEDFLQLSVKSICTGQIEFLPLLTARFKAITSGRSKAWRKQQNLRAGMNIAQNRGCAGVQRSVLAALFWGKYGGGARIQRVQVLFLLGFSRTCWGANNKTQAVHRFSFDKSTVSISLREKIAAEMKGHGGWTCFWC